MFKLTFVACFAFLQLAIGLSAESATQTKILVVVAHPDDEYYLAATAYHLAQERGSLIDQLVITSGESGFHYSAPSEKFYQLKLSDEAVARAHLPSIREQELNAAGKILGIKNHYFLKQKDTGFTQDAKVAQATWDLKKISQAIQLQLTTTAYDFIITLSPSTDTHGAHQAATELAVQAALALPEAKRPVVLGALTQLTSAVSPYHFDRTQKMPNTQGKMSYQVIVNWMIAEHKSQGFFQTYMGQDDREEFKILDTKTPDAEAKTHGIF